MFLLTEFLFTSHIPLHYLNIWAYWASVFANVLWMLIRWKIVWIETILYLSCLFLYVTYHLMHFHVKLSSFSFASTKLISSVSAWLSLNFQPWLTLIKAVNYINAKSLAESFARTCSRQASDKNDFQARVFIVKV